ncbi:MAG: hypothetical protein A3J58_01245 [Candidatus Sungbacteria bacterium RIFCSPHIGHO2_02_FULL_52_23]|uniref:Uncharacterized protein n=1 Tax=Candidatus Sungbacteria bacterium RIFCSPHIGHO2_02_FULL_52_23 TaxID=1802274 RepID=A0A1G2KVA9_9BACT|nr:MAG: hypothetical protein A3J58_01245 [Candidatus Sungbacteria bacterium RIFCSPHIGHO2_02_FULL_52_23]
MTVLSSASKKNFIVAACIILLATAALLSGFVLSSKTVTVLRKTASLSPAEFRSLEPDVRLEAIERIASEKGIKEAQAMIRAAYPDEQNADHELGHRIGEMAFQQSGFDGLAYCDASLAFGCFHGVAFAAVKKYGLRDDIAQKFWDGCQRQTTPGNCLHGLGHAITVVKNYNLIPAFEECERILTSDNDRFWCYDGVVMEDITRTLAGRQNPYASLTDPRAPCNTFPKKYEAVCVRNHITFVKERMSLSYEEMLELCESYADGVTVRECVHMTGNAVAGSRQNPGDVINLCGNARSAYRQSCLEGGVVKFSMGGDFAHARELCVTLDPGEAQQACFSKIDQFKHERDTTDI